MKNLILFKPLLFFIFSLFFISASHANDTRTTNNGASNMVPPEASGEDDDHIGPVRVNWVNEMVVVPGSPDEGDQVYIILEDDSELNVGIGINATSGSISTYPDLYIAFDFGGQTGMIGPLLDSDLTYNATTGFYESAYYPPPFIYSSTCDPRPVAIFNLDISIKLLTLNTTTNEYESYPVSSQTGLFDSAHYDNLSDGVSTSKNLVCKDGVIPGGGGSPALVNNNHNGQSAADKTNDTPTEASTTTTTTSQFNPTNQSLTNQADIVVTPNPFVDEFTIQYQLDRSSDVEIKVFDITGQQILTRKLGEHTAGIHQQELRLDDHVAPGLCIVQVYFLDMVRTVKLVKL